MVGDHAAMYAFDLHQQFGWAGPLLALAGLAQLVTTNWRHAALVLTVYVVNVLFAFGYNVGDTHVFYLPSHLIVALLAAPGTGAGGQRRSVSATSWQRCSSRTRGRGRGATIRRSTAAMTIDRPRFSPR